MSDLHRPDAVERARLFVPYLPQTAARALNRDGLPAGHRAWPLAACVLLADISGFTGLVERLAQTDPQRGAERLQGALNQCFTPLVEIVQAAGGDVLKFPGDAALALWTAEDDRPGVLAAVTEAAARCGLALQDAVESFAPFGDQRLRLRVAIGAGTASAAFVGGVDGRWEFVVDGAAVRQLQGALHAGHPGEVVLSPEAAALTAPRLAGSRRDRCLVLAPQGYPPRDISGPESNTASVVPAEAVLRAFVPRPVQARLDAGQAAWLAEFRTVTVLFLNLGIDADHEEQLHAAMQAIQAIVGRYGGSVNQLVADDKGIAVVVGFGVAESVYEDNPVRAIKTALELRERLPAIGVAVHAGLTTGRVFTGTRGAASRMEFALIGDAVNLAARFSASGHGVLCDTSTRAAAAQAIDFDEPRDVTVKGKAQSIRTFAPRGLKVRTARVAAAGSGIVGRAREIATIDARLDELAKANRGGVIFLEGEAGIGKSTLVDHVLAEVAAHGIRALAGAADSIEQATAYLAWRPVVAGLVGPVPDAADGISRRLRELVGDDLAKWAPLLNPMLPETLAETDATTGLNADNRVRLTRELAVRMVQAAAETQPLLLVFEDGHWMDSASWELIEAVVANEPRALVLITQRDTKDRTQAFLRLAQHPAALRIALEGLAAADVPAVVCRRLGVAAIPDAVATAIGRRAEGQPLFAEELALALRDAGLLAIADGVCRLTGSAGDLAAFPFPTTVNGVVASRIDRLSAEQQLTLKVASVLGRHFSRVEVTEIHPLAETDEDIAAQLGFMIERGLLKTSGDGATNACLFSHAVVQDVAYELMPFTQRRELHQRAAVRLERSSGDGAEAPFPLLAHHWERAEVTPKAMEYLEKAGGQALHRDGANHEAQEFFTRLIALAEAQPKDATPETVRVPHAGVLNRRDVRLARWEYHLTQSLLRQGQHRAMLGHLERCLALLRQRTPQKLDLTFALELATRLLRAPRRPAPRATPPPVLEALLAIVRTYELLGVSAYFTGNVQQGMQALMHSVRWAERVGPTPEMSRAYSTFAIIMGVFHRPATARQYVAIARSIAEDLGDQAALFAALGRGQLPLFIVGQWQEAMPLVERAVAMGTMVGDTYAQQVNRYMLGRMRFNQGQLPRALDDFQRLLVDARTSRTEVNQLYAMSAISETMFRMGRWDEAIAGAEETLSAADGFASTDQNARFEACGVLAASWLRKQDPKRARAVLERGITAGRAGGRSSYAPQAGFMGISEVLLAGMADVPEADTILRGWLGIMRVEGFLKPIVQPWHLIIRACRQRAGGRPTRAVKNLRRAIALADGMTLPFESAYAHAELARTLPDGDDDRQVAASRAADLFARIGATREFEAHPGGVRL